jgi:hypothetical protein
MKRFGGNFKIFINQNYSHMEVEIFGIEDHGSPDHPFVIGYDGDHLIEQAVNRENEMTFNFKPLLRIGMFQFEGLVKAFVDYANESKIHTEAEDHLKGKLEAKEAHLADMQEMSKKLLDAIIKIKQL